MRDAREALEREMGAFLVDGGAGAGIDLHQRYLRPALPKLLQAQGVFLDFLPGRFLLAEGWEQALNDDGALTGKREDVLQGRLQRDLAAIDAVQIRLGAAIEFEPDVILASQQFQPFLNTLAIQPAAVAQEHHFEERDGPQSPDVSHRLEGFGELGRQGGFAVPAEGHVPETTQFRVQRRVVAIGLQLVAGNQRERPLQLRRHHFHIQPGLRWMNPAIHLTINAVEIAEFVRVHVDPDRQPMGALGNHDIDKPVVQKIPGRAKGRLPMGVGPVVRRLSRRRQRGTRPC